MFGDAVSNFTVSMSEGLGSDELTLWNEVKSELIPPRDMWGCHR